MMMIFSSLAQAIVNLLVETASAQGPLSTIVEIVASPLPEFSGISACSGGSCGFLAIAALLIRELRPLIVIFASLFMTIAAFRIIVGQEEDALDKARAIFSACAVGIILAFLIEPFIGAFYGTAGEVSRGGISVGSNVARGEVFGLINWVLSTVSVLAIAVIIVTGLQAIANAGSEEGITSLRKAILAMGAGIMLLALRFVISDVIGADLTPSAPLAVAKGVAIVSYFLGFLALVAVAIIIYAGILMVLNFGREEPVTQAKSLIIRAIIGLVIVLLSLVIIRFVIEAVV